MASEYLKKKYQDVKPDEPVVMTKKQKRENWWYYHRVPLLLTLLGLGILGFFIYDMVSTVEPDYQFAYISSQYLEEEKLEQIDSLLTSLADDKNDDGKAAVFHASYILNEEDPMEYVTNVTLSTDLAVGTSQIYLLEDPVAFQRHFEVLMQRDGTAMEEGGDPEACLYYRWSDCPALSGLDLGTEIYIARRAVQKEEDAALHLWDAMTQGAVPVDTAE